MILKIGIKNLESITLDKVKEQMRIFLENKNYVVGSLKKLRLLFTIFILFFLASKTYSIDFKELETKNISFWFVEDNSVPIVSISFTIFGGSSLDPAGKDGLTNLMVSLMDEGTERYSGTKLRELMKLNGVKLRLSAQKNKIDGTFQVISTQLKKVLKF